MPRGSAPIKKDRAVVERMKSNLREKQGRKVVTKRIREQQKDKKITSPIVSAQLRALQKRGTTAVMNDGRVTGVRDAQKRLTGYDASEIMQRMMAKTGKDRPSATERRLLALEQQLSAAPTTPEAPTPTTVKRTELAQEIEAERARRRKLGLSPLGNRSLLSNTSTLGAS